jgi:RNA polymerase primary sigma factor
MRERLQSIPINQEEIYSYLKDIRKIKVMTPEREKELSKIMSTENLSKMERERVEQEIIEGNLRFVITVAKTYQNQGLELPDLIAEGNIGLIKAIKSFDWTKNLRFISYAVWWVRQSILQSLNENARTIRLPVNIVQEVQKEKKLVENGLAEESDKMATLPSLVYLDKSINEEGDTLLDVIINDGAYRPDEMFDNKDILKQKLMDTLNILDERERIIIEDYFGLTGCCRTLEDIGDELSLTKERVRQIKEKALRKLRNECSVLFDYL